jgi:L-ascorbate metabolism protein UlaG (beta-lactamase superfamily)
MIIPLQQDAALLRDIAEVSSDPSLCHLWWLGQSGYLIQWQGFRLLVDPYLSDSLTEKYATTDQPHVRVSARCIAPDQLRGVPWVTSSHTHTDHLDGPTLLGLKRANPELTIILSPANLAFAQTRLAADLPEFLTIADGEMERVGPFSIHGITAAHNYVDRSAAGHCLYVGYVIKCGPFTIYHSGDTLWHDTLVAELRAHLPIDLALVPINGHDPARRVAGNLNGTEAAALAKAIGAKLAVPHHYDMFAFNTATPDEFLTTCARLQQPARVLQLGERLTLEVQDD